jgi:hypothetical protein
MRISGGVWDKEPLTLTCSSLDCRGAYVLSRRDRVSCIGVAMRGMRVLVYIAIILDIDVVQYKTRMGQNLGLKT